MNDEWLKFRQSVAEVMIQDKYRLLRRLKDLEQQAKTGKPSESALEKWKAGLEKWQTSLVSAQEKLLRRRACLPSTISFPDLPVCEKREEIATLINKHQVVVLAGETGSGKTTQRS